MSDFSLPDDSDSDGQFDIPGDNKRDDFLNNVENFESLGTYEPKDHKTQP